MLFIEYNEKNEELLRQNLSLEQITQLIKTRTGRQLKTDSSLCLNGTTFQADHSKLGLVYRPDIGFYLIAAQDIPANIFLMRYGGTIRTAEDMQNRSAVYCVDFSTDARYLDASASGDWGALLAHLPPEAEAPTDGIQCENLATHEQDDDYYFFSMTAIRAGSVLGWDYGQNYLKNHRLAPHFFSSNGSLHHFVFDNPSQIEVRVYDKSTGLQFESGQIHHRSYLYFTLASFIQLTLTPFQHLIQRALSSPQQLYQWYQMILGKQVQDENIGFRQVFHALLNKDCKPVQIEDHHAQITARVHFFEFVDEYRRKKPSPVHYFGAYAQFQGCEPPPGYEVTGNNTILVSSKKI